MGVKLRLLYDGFLSTQYFSEEVYASSTDVDRVVQSGMLLMAGLYPPSGKQVWNETLLWNPIPVHQDSLDKTVVSRGYRVNHSYKKRGATHGEFPSYIISLTRVRLKIPKDLTLPKKGWWIGGYLSKSNFFGVPSAKLLGGH